MSIELSLSSTYATKGKPCRVKVWKDRVKYQHKSGVCLFQIDIAGVFGFTYLRNNRKSAEYIEIQQELESKHGVTSEQFKTLVDSGRVTI